MRAFQPPNLSWSPNARAHDTSDVNAALNFDHIDTSPASNSELGRDEMCYSPRRRSPINRRRMQPEIRSSESWLSMSFRGWTAIFIVVLTCWLFGSNSLLLAPSSINLFHATAKARENFDSEPALSVVRRCAQLQTDLNNRLPMAETNANDLQAETQVEGKESLRVALWTSLNCSSFLDNAYPRKEIMFQRQISKNERGKPDPSSSLIVEAQTKAKLLAIPVKSIHIPPQLDYSIDTTRPSSNISRLQSKLLGNAVHHANHSYLTPPAHASAVPFRSRLLQARPSILWRYSLSDSAHVELEQIPPDIAAAVGTEYTAWDRARPAPTAPPLPPAAAGRPLGPNSTAGTGGAGRNVINRIWIWGRRRRRRRSGGMNGCTDSDAARGAGCAGERCSCTTAVTDLLLNNFDLPCGDRDSQGARNCVLGGLPWKHGGHSGNIVTLGGVIRVGTGSRG
jgi:hypothetical protein